MGYINAIVQRVQGTFGLKHGCGANWYPKKEKEVPKRYHKYMKEQDKKNIYKELYQDEEVKEDEIPEGTPSEDDVNNGSTNENPEDETSNNDDKSENQGEVVE